MPNDPGVRIWIVAGPEFTRVANALRAVDAALPTQFRKRLKDAAKPAVQDVKRRVRALDLPGGPAGTTGLRRRVARGVGVRASVGRMAALRITTSMTQPNEAIIPRGMDRPQGWRHPVFGNRDNWVTQPGLSWFREPIADHRDEFSEALQDALDWAADTIDNAGGG